MTPYRPLSRVLRERFGCRVQRITLDAGFSCPNRDGTIGSQGCVFCSPRGSGSVGIPRHAGIREQLREGKERMVKRYGAARFIAYLQAFTNTYAPVDVLERLYAEAIDDPDVVGLMIGTRPDTLPDGVLDLLQRVARQTWLTVELGLQSAHDRTLSLIGRGHDSLSFRESARRLRARGIEVCAHVIIGLPGEDREMIRQTARFLDETGIDGIKIHHLQVLENTPLARLWRQDPFPLLTPGEYVSLAVDLLERIDPAVTVHRLVGDAEGDLVAPRWDLPKSRVISLIGEEFTRRGSRQGDCRLTPHPLTSPQSGEDLNSGPTLRQTQGI